jgi:hypothetical protein
LQRKNKEIKRSNQIEIETRKEEVKKDGTIARMQKVKHVKKNPK